MNKIIFALLSSISALNAEDICCVKCPEDKIKTYSIIENFINHNCGESCLHEADFWKYKIFEPGMLKADSPDATPCHDNGYTNYFETETHGIPYVLSVQVDLY